VDRSLGAGHQQGIGGAENLPVIGAEKFGKESVASYSRTSTRYCQLAMTSGLLRADFGENPLVRFELSHSGTDLELIIFV
jgi:hypothetical protein